MTTREDSAVGARQWQLGVVEEWLAAALDPSSQRHIEMENLARAVRRLLNNSFGYISPSTVVSQLLPVRTSCDELAFNDSAECLAYVCWHLVDRYGRIHQALDALFRRGHLPLRRRGVSVLEVGSGPAPAVNATVDYYRQLAAWCNATAQPMRAAPVSWAATIDRGPTWGSTVHHLSEMLLLESGSKSLRRGDLLLFSTTYDDLEGFSTRALHHANIRAATRALLDEADREDWSLDERRARDLVLEQGVYPPAAYDLIVMCYFLTNTSIAANFKSEITGLARSLTPGGVLLLLGGRGAQYPAIYDELDKLAASAHLARVLSEDLRAQSDEKARAITADQIVSCLRDLKQLAPEAYSEVQSSLPKKARTLDSRDARFRPFHARAYKREGRAAFSLREKRRLARRRAAITSA